MYVALITESFLYSIVFLICVVLVTMGSVTANSLDKTISGGKVNSSNLSFDSDTTDWAGFYGTFEYGTSIEDEGDRFYSWNMQFSKATVFASQSGEGFSGDLSNLNQVTSSSDADNIPGIPSQGLEKASNTYNDSTLRNPEVSSLDKTVNTNVSYGQSSSFFTNYLYEYDDGSNQHPVYTTDTIQDETAFNGVSPINYQLLVGTNGSDGQTSTPFSFYVEVE